MDTQIERLVAEMGLQRIASQLQDAVLPAIGFTLNPAQTPCCIGTSKLGGRPSLPTGFDWPTNKDRRLDFLLQINLADVAPFDPSGLLPVVGTLTFFYDLKDQPWGFDPADLSGYRVIYTRDATQSSAHDVPDSEFALPECELRFNRINTLPHFGSRAADKLIENAGLTDAERDAYYELPSEFEQLTHIEEGNGNHHLLGHSANVQGDMQLEAQLVTNGLYCGNSTGYQDPKRKLLESGADDWLLLLQLDSDDSNGFMWGDCGMLYYWIRRDDLENLRFEKAWMTLQCS